MSNPIDSDLEMLGDFLVEAWEQIDLLDREFVALEEEPGNAERVNTIFRVMHTLKGGAGFLGLEMLECLTHYAETLLSKVREGELTASKERIDLLLATADATKSILRCLEHDQNEGAPRYNELMVSLKRAGEVQVDSPSPLSGMNTREMDGLLDFQAQLMAALDGPAEDTESPPPPQSSEPSRPATPANEGEENAPVGSTGDTRIRVNVDLLDKLMNLVGELVLSRNQILQLASHLDCASLTSASQRINLVTSELQEHIMQTRMQPISTQLNRFPRILRDLCAQTGKDARFAMEGQDTGLDRTILEAIKDPLTHILRNSVDHGIESPEARLQAGKSPRGLIYVRAYHEGGQVTIEISDDGGGIDPVKVKAKAVASGMLSAAEAERLSERDTLQLIFQAGFSTAEKITTLSGRGVGMDVVRASVERLGGTVDLSSQLGQGTTVKLRLPLTLAIIPALVVTSGNERYAIPQVSLQELVRLEGSEAQSSIETIYGSEVYRLRGELLPLLRLRSVLGLPSIEGSDVNIVVVSADGSPFGLIVDGVCDTEEIVVKPLTRELKQLQLYAGATIMGDGKVALIIDIGGLARSSRLLLEAPTKAEAGSSSLANRASVQRLLLFHLDGQEKYAIPLTLLSRLEEFQRNQVEQVRGKSVVQYRGRLLPLLDMSEQLLGYAQPAGETLHVLVFSHQGNDLGLVVGEILDVVEDALSIEPGSGDFGTMGTAIVNGRATTVVDVLTLIQSAQPEWLKSSHNPKESSVAGRRLLVVDDSSFGAALTSSYLQAEGYAVMQCRGPSEVQERLAREEFDAVIVEAGTQGASKLLETLVKPGSSYSQRILTTTQRGRGSNYQIPAVEPFGRQELLAAVASLAASSDN